MQLPVYFDDFLDGTEQCTKKFVTHPFNETIQWSDIQSSLNVAAEKKNGAFFWIKSCLGYLPAPCIYVPHLSFLQVLIKNMEEGVISKEQFSDDLVVHARHVRNDDMKKDGWVASRNYKYDYRKAYKVLLPLYKQPARDRLCTMLGYQPELKYSLGAELHLRQLFEMDYYRPDLPYCDFDFKAATIVSYRQNYYKHDEQRADASGLMGLDLNNNLHT